MLCDMIKNLLSFVCPRPSDNFLTIYAIKCHSILLERILVYRSFAATMTQVRICRIKSVITHNRGCFKGKRKFMALNDDIIILLS